MKTLLDPDRALTEGLAAIRTQYNVPQGFAPEILAAADEAAKRVPNAHVDRTAIPFVTLDPASSTDLDQAFAIEAAGNDLLLRYAIADVAWFVDDGGLLDVEAWRRGESLYLPDGKASLYPPALGEGAASLLPTGDRPAVIFAVRVAPDGKATLDGAERALTRSRAKLAYETATDADLPAGFAELARRVAAAEDQRGASRVDPPEQELARNGDGKFQLRFAPREEAEDRNAALSLATNLAVAASLLAHHTGLFRVMPAPDARAVVRLRHAAEALGVDWPAAMSLADLQKRLDGHNPREAALMVAIRRAGEGASYAPYRPGVVPWQAAVAATYAHATAPLRRLADRYVVRATLAIANGQAVPDVVSAAFEKLPAVMAHSGAIAGAIDRAVIDMAEAVLLHGREGESFPALILDRDDRGARIQLVGLPVVARVLSDSGDPGDRITVRLDEADPVKRTLRFTPAG
ncbi:MAG: RNB domain-containing ribonuclease [Sphingomonas sp. 66-10]|uniref:RNB domain-containing ribonuclease n=1 Tax=Sphingomonas sp. 66-10 TaxID=1895848 RepID=UPI000928AAC7|nr:RNB domain-containing ribonuclease [Sphingomonas sp. 66-10]OJU17462.1 MAG: RNB domain-containing ribonuclease [Sphingomonas sp. 66-10]